jgi:hypothetical protein
MDIQELGWGANWIDLAQDRYSMGICKFSNETSGSINCEEFSSESFPLC